MSPGFVCSFSVARIRVQGLGETARQFAGVHEAVTSIPDEGAERAMLDTVGSPNEPLVLSFLNAHAANLAWRDRYFSDAITSSDVILRDGVGVRIGLRMSRRPAGLNMNGTDFIPRVMELYRGSTIALFGTRDPWLRAAAAHASTNGLVVVATEEGFSPDSRYIQLARESRPALIILGMGMPRQEGIAIQLRAALDYPVLIVNGGAILDFLAGKKPRAPAFFRDHGSEWTFRLAMEPKRLARRYLVGNPTYVLRLFLTELIKSGGRLVKLSASELR